MQHKNSFSDSYKAAGVSVRATWLFISPTAV